MNWPRIAPALALFALMLGACSDSGTPEPSPDEGALESAVQEPSGDAARLSLMLEDSAPLANPQECADGFEPERDYFPAKAKPRHARGFTVAYFGHYKVVEVMRPGGDPLRYALYLCGTPEPEVDGARTVEIPVRSLVTTSSTELPHLVQLGVIDRWIGHDKFMFVNNEAARQRIDAGKVVEIRSGTELDLERLIDLDPDLLLIDSVGDPTIRLLPRLWEIGIASALVPSYLETTPLGRAEWMLYTAFFLNREDRAERLLERITTRYSELARLGRDATDRPQAFSSGPIGGVWYAPGGASFVATLLADAGADYLWAEDDSAGSLALDIEVVYEKALEAEYWIQPNNWRTLDEIRGIDERFVALRAYREGGVYGTDARLSAHGGDDYWETGTARPDLVLADLLRIFHPDRLPEHRLIYHRRLD